MAIVSREIGRPWLTLNEVSVLAEVPEGKIRDELDAGVVLRRKREDSSGLLFELWEAFFFRAIADLPFPLGPAHRKALYDLLLRRARENEMWRKDRTELVLSGKLSARVETSGLRREIVRRARIYRHGKRRVDRNPSILGGEPVFKGTRVSIRHVGGLLKKGVPLEELREDFPHLSEQDFEFARIFAELHRPPGRPRKPLELKRSAR